MSHHLNRMNSMFYAGLAAALISLGAAWAQSAHTDKPAQTPTANTPPTPAAGLYPSGPGSLSGKWETDHYKGTMSPARGRVIAQADGTLAPLQPWARDLVEKRIAAADAGRPFVNTLAQCLPGGVPEMDFGAPYAVQFLETPGQVTILYDEQNHFRLVRMNQPHPSDPDPSYMGDSIGHWEDDTLVVDTVALKENTTLDMVGTPHSDQLHVIERFRRIAPDKVEISIHLDDPKTFTRPWTSKSVYKTSRAENARMDEYICVEDRSRPTAPK